MAKVSIYKFIVHKKWTTLGLQKVDDFKFIKGGRPQVHSVDKVIKLTGL